MKKIGLALGAGGARGIAHVAILEALDELNIKPCVISGTSIGAIVGLFYSAGFSTSEMRKILDQIIYGTRSKFWEIHKKSDFVKYFDLLDPTIKTGGLLRGDKLASFLSTKVKVSDFKELKIPFKVLTTDYYEKSQVIIDKGDLLSAVRASYALPFLFAPIEREGKLLIDGGMVNPLPFDVIRNDCDITVAVDVSATNEFPGTPEIPPSYEVLFSSFQIMQSAIVNEKLKTNKPDILIKTNIKGVRVHEFMKAEEILKNSEVYKIELKKKLQKLISV
ncbi:MAG TPA: patatin-like phospholipase family protein [Ignavibacteria bacterium]|nr:patatin-like phospholipase family protein [Ignavibacteria bacterium]